MGQYIYEMHMHTCQASACGKSTGKEHVRYYKDLGYTGIFITDHFFKGNSAVPRELSWHEWVDRFCAGYEDALEEGLKVGLDVFFAWEENFRGDEYLIYGLDKQWLLEHPEVRTWTRKEQYETIHRDGGSIIQAHPFRDRGYIERILLNRDWVDGIEVANAGNTALNDSYAKRYGDRLGMFQIVGSDNHHSYPGCPLFAVSMDHRLSSAKEWADMVRAKASIDLIVPEDRFQTTNGTIESFWLDENECAYPTNINWLKAD